MTTHYTQANPRKPEQIASLRDQPKVLEAAKRKGVKDVLHFTTIRGAIGVLAACAVKSRIRLTNDKYLEHVYKANVQYRKDNDWLDYVNLSIERINDWMFDTSTRWHPLDDNPWVVLSFGPEILAHSGVVFTTTNNIYPSCRRQEGLCGFLQMFAETVYGRHDQPHNRTNKQLEWPTDRQAEVLYPSELSIDYLQRIDVQMEESVDTIRAAQDVLYLSVPVHHAPKVFE